MIKVIAFDVFGTVFDLSDVPKRQIKAYVDHVRQPVYSPLRLPLSWESLLAHPDAREGINLLREKYIVVTCSNGPLGLLTKMSKLCGIIWDAIIPVAELSQSFKPHPNTYLTICHVLDVAPHEVMLVTANPTFGDVEGAADVGMRSMVIRNPGKPQNIIQFAQWMETATKTGLPYLG